MKVLIGTKDNGLVIQEDNKTLHLVEDGKESPVPGVMVSEVLCKQDTSYFGETLSNERRFLTPYGTVSRTYRASGGGLEHVSIGWRMVEAAEIASLTAQAAKAAEDAALAIERSDELARLLKASTVQGVAA